MPAPRMSRGSWAAYLWKCGEGRDLLRYLGQISTAIKMLHPPYSIPVPRIPLPNAPPSLADASPECVWQPEDVAPDP